MQKILLVLPTLNEEEAIPKLGGEVPEGYDVLVVDSGSTDRTKELAKDNGWEVIDVKYGRGQGSGIRTGMEWFLERSYDVMLLADADYTDVLSDLPKVVDKVEGEGLDIVLGIRDMNLQREILGTTSILAKRFVALLIRVLCGYKFTEMLTGVWGFKRKTIEDIQPHLYETGFEYGFEIIFNGWLQHKSLGQVDVGFRPRVGETKLTLNQRLIQVYMGTKYGMKVLHARLTGRYKTKK